MREFFFFGLGLLYIGFVLKIIYIFLNFPAQLLELYLLFHIYPSRIKGMATSVTFCIVYLVWIMIIAHVASIWVYPILKILDPVPRAAFMIICSLFGSILYIIGEILNNIIWGHQISKTVFDQSVLGQKQININKGRGKKPQKVD